MSTANDPRFHPGDDTAVYVISVAAQLSGLHPQTLRQYDRLGLVSPQRTPGGRLYSMHDIQRLQQVQRLSQTGLNLEGIRRVLALEEEVAELRALVDALHRRFGNPDESPSTEIVRWQATSFTTWPRSRPS
jgi:MerR family transcriptional regulator, heat shock protein HspR